MKRSQDKTKSSPMKQTDSSKLRDMQKAYGVLPKDVKTRATTKSVKSTGTTSTQKGQSSSTVASQKTRNSTGNIVSKPSESSFVRRSTNPPDGKSSSKIIAASKANYAEKYGSLTPRSSISDTTTSPTKGKAMADQAVSNSNIKKVSSTTSSTSKQRSTMKTSQKAPSKSSSISEGLTFQKPPAALYDSEEPSEPPAEDYDEEDFEEDYESDFEEMENSENDEPSEGSPADSVNRIDTNVTQTGVVPLELEDEYDKSSSIKEFEALEKMVETAAKDTEPLSKPSNKVMMDINKNNTITDNGAAGEPVGYFNSREDEDEDEEEEDSDQSEAPALPKQNAFPTTTGFSISTSLNSTPFEHIGTRSSTGGRRASSSVIKATLKAPNVENDSQKKKRTNRGKIIQGMIRLDRVTVDIFHLAPYQYERFMAVFSGNDRRQVSIQTDQDKSEESVQTEPIDQIAKWTQKPPTWSTTSSSCDIRIVRQEALGVGSDDMCEDLSPDQKIHKQFDFLQNWEQLSKFILRASRKILYVLEADKRIKLPSSSGNKGSLETIKMNRGLSVLSKLAMHTLAEDGEFVACANGESQGSLTQQDKSVNGNKKHTSKNVITVWSLKEPSMPLYFLRVWGHVSALKIHMIGRMVVSGNRDGSLNVWNLDEPLCYHSHYQEQTIRTPSVNSSCMTPTHVSPVAGIEMFSDTKNTFSIVSIDAEGIMITWSCHRSHDTLSESTLSQHNSAWSTVSMSARHQIQLSEIIRDQVQVTCFQSWDADNTVFIFGTFNGYVAKGQLAENKSTPIDRYQERVDSNSKITCMDVSKALNILVVGCEDGRCRLFEMTRNKMVLSLGGKEEPLRVKWSGRRASVLYVALKDSLLIWDLLSSDMNPWKTIHLKDIKDFVLYTPPHKEYLVIITGKDLIISTPADEVKPLNPRDYNRIQSYFSLLS